MFQSNDSLFDEMTKQCENGTDNIEPTTCKPESTATHETETLPNIVLNQNKKDAAQGLVMPSLNPADVDAEIDNDRDMPINPPSHKEAKPRKLKGNDNTENTRADKTPKLPRNSSCCSKNKNKKMPPKSRPSPKADKEVPNNP